MSIKTSSVRELYKRQRAAWAKQRHAENAEAVSPTDHHRWDAEELYEGFHCGHGVDMVAEALARAELRGERRVRLDIEMERSSVRSEKP
ncbi:MAG: hypothetical protein EKK60_05935 [Gordonia sp. (in: high G+C Gram-positive bacteria)]|nr:MAG: hypothetical protein EKK60_05935 [Gordonia sp. (in: high G+C Gram-positive bacteria)]